MNRLDMESDVSSAKRSDLFSKISLVLVSPCPPPVGGMTHWTELITSALRNRDDLEMTLVDSSLGIPAGQRTMAQKIFGMLGVVRRGLAAIGPTYCEGKVLHICTSGGYGFLRDYLLAMYAKKRGVPSCVHMHFGRIPDILQSRSVESLLLKKVLSVSNVIVTMDQGSFDALNQSSLARNVVNVPNPIAIERFDEPACKEESAIFVGHVYKAKGVEVLLEAWRSFQVDHPSWNLDIVGPIEDGYKKQLRCASEGLSVAFLGEMSHDAVLDRISRASILVLPSFSEGFPNVILEAMSRKTVAIGSPVGAISEMLDNDKRLLVPCGAHSLLAEAMSYIADNPQEALLIGEQLYSRTVQLYSVDSVVEKLLGIWEKLLIEG